MANRNPNIPSERRADMENRENNNEEKNNQRLAVKDAELREQGEYNPDKADHLPGKRDQSS